MVVLVIFLVGFLSVNYYLYIEDTFDAQSANAQIQTEQNIADALRLSDLTWNILDENLNERMKSGLLAVNETYERSGRDLSRLDLLNLKAELGDHFEIYIINESGVITATTYPPELGQDFRQIPYFYKYLTRIRQSSGFFPDRVIRDKLGAGQLRKFAYMPTADHKYILELSYSTNHLGDLTHKLDDEETVQRIAAANPHITGCRVFNSMDRLMSDNSLAEEPVQGYLKQVIATHTPLEIADPERGLKTRYVLVDLKNDAYGSDPSRIVEITYNTGKIQNELNTIIYNNLVFGAAAIFIGFTLAFFLSRRMTQPIRKIADDVEIIAQGDLDHRIGTTEAREFAVLEQGLNTMVDSIKKAVEAVKDQELFQHEVINNLPVAVLIKRVRDGRYIFWNKTSEQLFERTSAEVIGKTDRELFAKEIAEKIEHEDREAILKRGAIRNKLIQNRHKCGRMIHLMIVPVMDSKGNLQYLLKIAEDVTEENLRIKMDLLNSITRHDVLDQLSIILSNLERAQLKNTHESIQAFFDNTMGSVESIKNQLAFVRVLQDLGLMSPSWQSVEDSIGEALLMCPSMPVDIQSEVTGIEIYADSLLPRVFFTLISDSLKHGGKKLSHIHISTQATGSTLVILYEDDGVGVAVSEKGKIFDFGYGTGTGLGLFLIRELLGFTDITIRETGEPGKGVRFEILVPEGRFRLVGNE